MDNEVNMGDLIKHRREELQLSIKELADIVGISPAYLGKIEKGERQAVSWQIMDRIRFSLGITQIGVEQGNNLLESRINYLSNLLRMYNKRGDIGLLEIQDLFAKIVGIIRCEL